MTAIRVITYNVRMWPGILGKGDEDLDRAGKIADILADSEEGFDVICLQELLDEDVRDLLASKLRVTHPYQVPRIAGRNIFKQDSGLFFASKFPIRRDGSAWSSRMFRDCSGLDCLVEKGIFGATLDVSSCWSKESLVVFNSHFQSDQTYAGQYETTRTKQIGEARSFIFESLACLSHRSETAAVLCGDFNVVGESPEHIRLLGTLSRPRDLFRLVNDLEPGYTWDSVENTNMIPPDDGARQRLDYIFAFDELPRLDSGGAGAPLARIECEACQVHPFGPAPDSRLSDHFAVWASIQTTT